MPDSISTRKRPDKGLDIRAFNRRAWDRQVEQGNPWTIPVGPEAIAAARRGQWQIVLTPTKPVPRDWFGELSDCDLLCLASGGGQQGPILAAAGARVTVLDNSPRQLAQDRRVAEREGLALTLVEGDMANLENFVDESFGLIVHPVASVFVPNVRPVWAEAYRVLRRGGALLSGFANPVRYVFDWELAERTGVLQAKYALPYSDLVSLTAEQQQHYRDHGEPFEFGHTLDDQIGGQIEAGFLIGGFFEDGGRPEDEDPLSRFMPSFVATRAIKP